MPELPNERQEAFAKYLAADLSHYKAYKAAGYKPNSKSASSLAQNEAVVARVKELKNAALALTGVTPDRVVDEYQKLAFANMLDFIKIDDDGQPELDFTRLTRDQAAAISEITTDVITNPRTGEVTRRTKFKLLDKKAALADLGRYLGMFVERKDIRVGGVMFHISKEDASL